MNCYAWKIPEGCYSSALVEESLSCPGASWWWIAAAVAGGLLLFTGGGKRAKAKTARVARRRR
jgi:hypothetical protein